MGLLILSKSGVAEPAKSDEIFFENNVRSILTRYCISCHNPQKHKGGLDLTSRKEAFKGGDSGPPIIAGKPSESLLIDVISYNSDIQMPPKGKMPDSDLQSLKNWVASGAIWPDSAKLIATTDPDPSKPLEHTGPKLRSKPFQINDQDKSWWSFQPIRKPQIPDYKKDDFIGNEIDALLLHKLKDKDLHLNPSATRRELIRRAYFDLIGLPPSPEAVIAFENDIRPNAWEKLIDVLLARPQYG